MSNLILENNTRLLTANVEEDGITSFSMRVLKAAVESIVVKVNLGQNQFGSIQLVLGLDVCSIHLPWHWCVTFQGAALHGDIAAPPLVLVSCNWKPKGDNKKSLNNDRSNKKWAMAILSLYNFDYFVPDIYHLPCMNSSPLGNVSKCSHFMRL